MKNCLSDTIIHEYIHLAQACKGDAIYPYENFPSDMDESSYPPYQHQTENEARYLAKELSPLEVSQLLVKTCIMKLR